MLDAHSPLPLYHQLAEWLLAQIREGSLRAGERVPSEHALAERFGVGRPTVRQATDLLVRRGALTRRRGAGTFVRPPAPAVDLFSLSGTRQAFRAQGLPVEPALLAPLARVAVPAGADQPFAGRDALFVPRLSKLGRTPVLLEHIHLCPELFAPLLQLDLAAQSLSDLVRERLFLRPSGADQRFAVLAVRGKIARTLGVAAGTQLLFVQRAIHFKVRREAIFVELYCRTDRMMFSQSIQGADDA